LPRTELTFCFTATCGLPRDGRLLFTRQEDLSVAQVSDNGPFFARVDGARCPTDTTSPPERTGRETMKAYDAVAP
jgi:hypothetical protein